jgi:hypothetical protein
MPALVLVNPHVHVNLRQLIGIGRLTSPSRFDNGWRRNFRSPGALALPCLCVALDTMPKSTIATSFPTSIPGDLHKTHKALLAIQPVRNKPENFSQWQRQWAEVSLKRFESCPKPLAKESKKVVQHMKWSLSQLRRNPKTPRSVTFVTGVDLGPFAPLKKWRALLQAACR